ncbi:phage antirepressor KilAC domain-containing protein [Eubacterium sp. 1001713B170207_170306_E7]|uniref:phage antirepressor KilAC domain-containing protein n=1 Tax=Eubacterium sp. 1001713B170207_170306_E7 TaxID=2787097 RepID=UPI0018989326|nr:phage antirepressor KilAC domain-containing protein [Eubacterium sp. 1001713B170207_170306_E7]
MDKSRQLQEEVLVLRETLGRARPKLLFADSITASQGSISMGDMAKLLWQNGNDTGHIRPFEKLRRSGVLRCQKGSWNKASRRFFVGGTRRREALKIWRPKRG